MQPNSGCLKYGWFARIIARVALLSVLNDQMTLSVLPVLGDHCYTASEIYCPCKYKHIKKMSKNKI